MSGELTLDVNDEFSCMDVSARMDTVFSVCVVFPSRWPPEAWLLVPVTVPISSTIYGL